MKNLLIGFFSLLLTCLPLGAFAQVPDSGNPNTDTEVHGRILYYTAPTQFVVRDAGNNTDKIDLHSGTIINPRGITLQPGMIVQVFGYSSGDSFQANEIDTPYYYSDGDWYYAGHPWNYYDGDAFGIGFFFGAGVFWLHHHYGYGLTYEYPNQFRYPRNAYPGRFSPVRSEHVTHFASFHNHR